jgi:hypothetical protein
LVRYSQRVYRLHRDSKKQLELEVLLFDTATPWDVTSNGSKSILSCELTLPSYGANPSDRPEEISASPVWLLLQCRALGVEHWLTRIGAAK